jgi:hypothetical protein
VVDHDPLRIVMAWDGGGHRCGCADQTCR